MSVDRHRFPAAPLDRPTRLVTLASGLLIALGVPLLAGDEGPAGWAVLGTLGAGILVLSFGFAPRSYELEGPAIVVRRRLFGSLRLLVTGEVGRLPWTFGLGGFRLGGSAGLFGWYGLFHKPGIGRYRAYLTDRSRIVGCTTDRGLVLISPADPDAFLAAAARHLPAR